MRRINIIFWLIYILIIILFLGFGIQAFEKMNLTLITIFLASLCSLITFFEYEWGIYLLIVSMLFSPEILIAQLPKRDVVLRIDDILILVITLTWLARVAIMKNLQYLVFTPVHRPFFIFIAASLFSTAFGILNGYIDSATRGFLYVVKFFEFFMIFFLTVNVINSDRVLIRALNFYFITFTGIILYVVISQPFMELGIRVTAPFEGKVGEPNTLGGYLAFSFIILLSIALKNRNYFIRYLLMTITFLSLIPFLNTLSRGSYIAIAISLFALFFMTDRKISLLVFIVIATIVFSNYSVMAEKVINRIKETFIISPDGEYTRLILDESTRARLNSYVDAVKLWRATPFLGRGITGAIFIDGYFVRVLVEAGVVGLFSIVYTLYSVFRVARNLVKNIELNDLQIGLVQGFIAGFLGLIGHSAGANTFLIVRISGSFWIMAGMIGYLYLKHFYEQKNITHHYTA
ncbi:MAG: O-antigen ligase family protein [Candidatus Hydrogenedentota bacterium]